jgi:small subunit ribosomal protein S1
MRYLANGMGPRGQKAHGAHTLQVWSGTVVGVYGDDVFVELGPRMQGVISRRQFDTTPQLGEVFEFTLRGQEEGLWALARREAKSLATWEEMEAGSLVQAHALRANHDGLELKVGPVHAFMPKSHTGLARDQKLQTLAGKWLTCEVLEVDPARQRVLLSRKLVLQRERESERQREVGSLKLGDIVQGRVTRIEDYGVFVGFGRGLEGLVHVSNLAFERVGHPSEVVKPGESVQARVLAIRDGGRKIALGIKQMSDSPWKHLESRHFVGEIVEAMVLRVLDFGAFVGIERGVEGLLPASECGLSSGQPLRAALRPGQALSLRVLEMDCEHERLALSWLHKDGSRIADDEAANLRSFEASGRFGGATPESKLGRLLRRARRAPG